LVALDEKNPFDLSGSYGKTRMAGLRSREGRMMIDSVVWAQYINVTNTETGRLVAITKATPTPYASGGGN